MLTIRDHHTGTLFDPWAHLGVRRRALLDRSWAGVFRMHLLKKLPVARLAGCFHRTHGRPSKDLHVAIGALILQQLHDLTDAETVEALAFHMTWHYALDIRDEADAYLCAKTLRNYRRLLIDRELESVLFSELTDELLSAFGVDVAKQRIDSTAIRSAMRALTRLGLFVETANTFLRELKREHPALYEKVDPKHLSRYLVRDREGCFSRVKPSDSKRYLPQAARDLYELASRFEKTEASGLASFGLLKRVFTEQCVVTTSSQGESQVTLAEPQSIPSDSVQNPSDPDASYNAHRGRGYMVQVMETYAEAPSPPPCNSLDPPKPKLITHVAVHSMNEHDSDQLEPALEDVNSRAVAPQRVVADTHYGSTANMGRCAAEGVDLISPSFPAKGRKQGLLVLEEFDLNAEGRVRRCPAGAKPISCRKTITRHQAHFSHQTCDGCSLQARCPVYRSWEKGHGYRLEYTPARLSQCIRRHAEQSESFREKYRWRAGVEGTISRLKHWLGLIALRVRGMKAVRFVAVLRALGLNIRRCAAAMAG